MIYLDLLIGFLKVGLFSFGGAYAAIPLIRDVVLSYGWLTDNELSYMIAVSESTPGPIMVNVATYVGSSQGGILGAFIATFATILPAFIIILLAMVVLKKTMSNKYVQATLSGLKPGVVGIILATGIFMLFGRLFDISSGYALSLKSLVVAVVLVGTMVIFKCIKKKNISPILLIVISAVLGMVIPL